MVTVTKAFSKTTSTPRDLITQEEADSCNSVASTIRLCKKQVPDASNGEIARFLGIRPQWVYNVLHQELKRG